MTDPHFLLDLFTPFPKNPTLSKFFLQIGRVEELGSGVLNVSKYLPMYAKGAHPQFVEGNPFVTIIALPTETELSEKRSEKTGVKTWVEAGVKTRVKNSDQILRLIAHDPKVTRGQLAEKLSITIKGVDWNLNQLKKSGRLHRVGPDKGGHWEITKAG